MRFSLALLCLPVVLTSSFACDAQAVDEIADAPAPPSDAAPDAPDAPDADLTGTAAHGRSCEVTAPAGVVSLLASAAGVTFAVASTPATDPTLLVLRAHGEGCDLTVDHDTPIAAGALLDIDDLGNIYVFPAEAPSPAAISTMLPGEFLNSMVAKVDPENDVTKLLPAGRGIWSFGVSPAGDALWVTACGPTGIFTITDNEVTPSMTAPDTRWEQLPSVLANDRTFWSIGYLTCDPSQPLTPACGYALVRTTPEGSEELDTTIVDFGAGFEQATLSRCGPHICGTFTSAVQVWDGDGEVLRTITPADALARPGEHIAQATGTADGVYVLLRSDSTESSTRIVFVPLQ